MSLINRFLLVCYLPIILIILTTTTTSIQAKRYTIQFQAPAGDIVAARAQQDAFLDHLKQQTNLSFSVRFQYTHALNAISIDVADEQNNDNDGTMSSLIQDALSPQSYLTRQPSVRRYWPGKRYPRPQSSLQQQLDKGTPNLSEAHAITGVQNISSTWSGQGIKLAILDTGVDYTHPALGGCFGDGCRIAHGYDLVGDHYGEGDNDEPVPDHDPMDACDGHGTHVAGIIAALGDDQPFTGVAPGVELGVWRIFGCEGDTDDDIILEAAERAIQAGMNIINLSLGGDTSAWQEDALAVALSSIADQGIMVVVAQGNEGRDGIARTPSPTIGRHVMAVSSVDNQIKLAHGFRVIDGNVNDQGSDPFFEYRLSDDSLRTPYPKVTRLILPPEPDHGLYACQPYQKPFQEKNSTVLVKRGKCSFVDKALNVQSAGGTGMLVYDEDSHHNNGLVSIGFKSKRVQIPVGSIQKDVITMIQGAENKSFVDVEQTDKVVELPSAGLSSLFSTWGPDAELHLKPDLAAVGGNVYSTFPINLGKYTTMSGTSMATPYMSGCIALYMQATGSRSPNQIFRALMNHAKPVVTQHHPSRLESPIKQGAGLVQIHDAIRGETTVSPYKLELNDTQFFEPEKILRIKNRSHVQRIYHLEHLPAAAIAGYDFNKTAVPRYQPLHVDANATLDCESTQLTLEPNATQFIHIRFSPPKSKHRHLLYGGYIRILSSGDEQIHVPYLGAQDNQRDLPIFDTMRGYPRIEPTNKTQFSFERGDDTMHLHIRLGSPTARLRSVLVNQENKRLGTLVDGYQKWVSRNDHWDSMYTLEWRGRIIIPSSALVGPSGTAATGGDLLLPPPSNTTSSPTNNNNIMNVARTSDGGAHGTKNWSSNNNNFQKKVIQRHVPPGRYKIRVSALKIFGDPLLQSDYEIWYSPEFEVID